MDDPPTIDLAQRDTVRVIATGRLKDSALLPLAASRDALAALAGLESVTNGRLRAQEVGLADLDPRELVFGRPDYTFVNAAFTYTRPGGNRFNGGDRGVWYCGFEAETAVTEVGYHLGRELAAIGRFDNVTDYAELLADFVGPFHDLRAVDAAAEPCLDPDPAVGYPAGQALAHRLRTQRASNGVVYPSLRRAGGICLAAFRPDLVQNLRQGGVWRLRWYDNPMPEVIRVSD